MSSRHTALRAKTVAAHTRRRDDAWAHTAAPVKLLGVLIQVHGPWVINFER
jgi:hypothetical protein